VAPVSFVDLTKEKAGARNLPPVILSGDSERAFQDSLRRLNTAALQQEVSERAPEQDRVRIKLYYPAQQFFRLLRLLSKDPLTVL